jgi:hypothetical protein
VSLSNNEYTFTCGIGFITDGIGAATDPAFSVGAGDIVVDNTTGQIYFITTVTFPGGTQMTATMRQLNNVRYSSGTNFVAGGSLSSTVGTLTIYNSRRVYPSDYRVNMTATSGSGTITYLICGDETSKTPMTLQVRVNDYLIGSNRSGSAADSVFPKFSKFTAVSPNGGANTVNTTARRSYYGEATLVVRGT